MLDMAGYQITRNPLTSKYPISSMVGAEIPRLKWTQMAYSQDPFDQVAY